MIKKIKKALKENGLTVKSLSKKAGYSRIHTSNVIHGHFKSPKAREAIAEVLGSSYGQTNKC